MEALGHDRRFSIHAARRESANSWDLRLTAFHTVQILRPGKAGYTWSCWKNSVNQHYLVSPIRAESALDHCPSPFAERLTHG
jgi:hypothetical protein